MFSLCSVWGAVVQWFDNRTLNWGNLASIPVAAISKLGQFRSLDVAEGDWIA